MHGCNEMSKSTAISEVLLSESHVYFISGQKDKQENITAMIESTFQASIRIHGSHILCMDHPGHSIAVLQVPKITQKVGEMT